MVNKITKEQFEEWKESDKFKTPTTPNELYNLLYLFFGRIRRIIEKENHTLKFDGKRQILSILHKAAGLEGVKVFFTERDGEWFIHNTPETTKEDIENLSRVVERFSKLYRHEAKEHAYGDDEQHLEMIVDGREKCEENRGTDG